MRSAVAVLLLFAATAAQGQFTLRARSRPEITWVYLSYPPVSGASWYVLKRASVYPNWDAGTNVGTSTTVGTGLSANAATLFEVVAFNSSGQAIATSNVALTTAYGFAQPSLVSGVTAVQASHVTELRPMIAAARTAAATSAPSWTHATLSGGAVVDDADFIDLRTGINGAISALGMTPAAFTDPTLANTVIRRVHLEEIRARIRNYPELVMVSSILISNRYFSPNGDGQKDTTTITAAIDRALSTNWALYIRNAGGTIVRTVGGSGNSISYAWDGRDDAGNVQPDGDYTIELRDSADPGYVIASIVTTIDNTLPVVTLATPASNATVSNIRQNGSTDLTITGGITDTYLASWKIEQTGNAQATTTISSSTANVPPTQALGTWHTAGVANGAYTLQATATDLAGNSRVVSVPVTLGNFSSSQTVHQIRAANGESITITSSVPFTLTETLTIRNAAGQTVRTLVNAQRGTGTYNDVWDGRNDGAGLVGDGLYRYVIAVTDGVGSMTWDETNVSAGGGRSQFNYPQCLDASGAWVPCSSTTSAFNFDPYTAKPLRLRYCVGSGDPPSCSGSLPALVYAKVSSSNETGATCGSTECIAAQYQPAGMNEIAWYGISTSGIYIAGTPNMTVIRLYDGISKNATLVYGTAVTMSNLTITPPMFKPGGTIAAQQYGVDVTTYGGRTVTLQAQFRNMSSGSVLRTITNAPAAAGHLTLQWDGRADNGSLVAPGTYDVLITATDSAGGSVTLRPLTLIRY